MASRVALVETDDLLPGLLPFQSWDVLGTAEVVYVRDAAAHPWADTLHVAGLEMATLAPASLERADLDLSRPGAPEDRRYAKALLEHALAVAERGEAELPGGVEAPAAVYLLGPDDDGIAPALAGMAADHDLEIELVFLGQPEGAELLRLVQVMRRLRDPDDGCPWDLEQDHQTLVRYLLEETYELLDAIEREHDVDMVEELGDVLLQIVFHARVAADRGAFGIDEVARGIATKLERRHPHVFGDGDAATAEDVQSRWDELKAQEKQRTGPFDGVPPAGPGLDLWRTLQRKAGKFVAANNLDVSHDNIEVADPSALPASVSAALTDAAGHNDPDAREKAVGEAIGTLVAYARHLDVDPERAARRAAGAFRDDVNEAVNTARR